MTRVLGLNAVQWLAVGLNLFVLIWAISNRMRPAQAVGAILWCLGGIAFSTLVALWHLGACGLSTEVLNLMSASLRAYTFAYLTMLIVLLTLKEGRK